MYVVKLLVLGGDVELNPGPPKLDPAAETSQVLSAINRLTKHLDERHDQLLESINEVKENQRILDT